MNNPVIDTLVDNLTPTKPLENKSLYSFYVVVLGLSTLAVLATFGLRFDYQAAIETGSMFWKPAIFLFVSLGGLFAMSSLSRPQGQMPKLTFAFIGIGLAILGWQTINQYPDISLSHISQSFGMSSANACLVVTSVGGILLTLAFWKFWLKKAASSRPVLLGAVSGFTSANIAAAAYALHCNMDMVLYVVGFYGVVILAMTLLGAVLGKKVLNW